MVMHEKPCLIPIMYRVGLDLDDFFLNSHLEERFCFTFAFSLVFFQNIRQDCSLIFLANENIFQQYAKSKEMNYILLEGPLSIYSLLNLLYINIQRLEHFLDHGYCSKHG